MSNGESKSWVTGVMDKAGMSKAEQARLRYKMDENKKKKDLEIQKSKADKIKQENIDKKAGDKAFSASVSKGVKNLAENKKQENQKKKVKETYTGPTENVISAESTQVDTPLATKENISRKDQVMGKDWEKASFSEKAGLYYGQASDLAHGALAVGGQIPGPIGVGLDLVNAGLYRGEEIANTIKPGSFPGATSGKYKALGSSIPLVGQAVSSANWSQNILKAAGHTVSKSASIHSLLSGGGGNNLSSIEMPPGNKGKYPT